MTFERTSGSPDPNSPHEAALSESELSAGEHADALLTNSPTLVDGAIYRITFITADAAGNESEPVRLTGILYDSVAPVMTLGSPAPSKHIRTLDIDYTLSEAMASATATWAHTGGTADPQSPRVIELSVPEMGQGNRSGTLSGQIPLVAPSTHSLSAAPMPRGTKRHPSLPPASSMTPLRLSSSMSRPPMDTQTAAPSPTHSARLLWKGL